MVIFPIFADSNVDIHALQFHPIRDIPADSLPALLVRVRPLHQQVEVAVAFAKRLCRCSKLCVLRLVGLAFPATHRIHLVLLVGKRIAHRESRIEKKSQNLDVAEYRAESWNPGVIQVLRLLRHRVCRAVQHLH